MPLFTQTRIKIMHRATYVLYELNGANTILFLSRYTDYPGPTNTWCLHHPHDMETDLFMAGSFFVAVIKNPKHPEAAILVSGLCRNIS